ncbi:ParM/StbA family protein [Noviherbaspirillum galbum]|uniref:PRTRC system protein D n=1 Tax=Noviherbaspirillum galbum TaxID=2709383 RepID=A0A6B3SW54_9BURK|nr:plasmid segregation protein ParM domain-containing protein [Noviherbaspirillum galbum]NEX64904.1 PRTRC system protein D [Noviherbaspirillum galbum]
MTQKTVRANDVGYGNNKFTTSNLGKAADGSAQVGVFPSIVAKAKSTESVGDLFGLAQSNNIAVQANNANFIVGDTALNHTDGTSGRNLNPNFPISDPYLALVRGSLYRMAVSAIDLLVVGLPMNTYNVHKDALRERLIGGHTIPNPYKKDRPNAGNQFSVEVKAARVLPQPVGALIAYSMPRGLYGKVAKQTNLVLDVGYGTFDWFLAEGIVAQDARCGAYQGGVSALLMAVADHINPDLKAMTRILRDIDNALNGQDSTFYAAGKDHNISDFTSIVELKAQDQINAMLHSVKSMTDVRNVVLTGGGATIFKPIIEKMLPGLQLLVDENPIFSNVLGFQMYGEATISQSA